eukprot:TRINITY_DN2213_c0_g4_i3.p1 TRINITY_DN2213_c0_g4~~TRINITY_DN2213_c0_g4_i3.p1  ORF type:complete len:505 (+),score=148.89 TRINITY_DN2213_c0_g4_i3:42-1556(+)
MRNSAVAPISDRESSSLHSNKAFIEYQKKNLNEIKEELNSDQKGDSRNMKDINTKLARLQDMSLYYAQKIETEKKRKEDLGVEIDRTENILEERRKEMRGEGKGFATLSKEIKAMELQLAKSLAKLNGATAKNRDLREQINSLRRERVIYDNIYKQIELELSERKKELFHQHQLKRDALDQREQALKTLNALRSKAVNEQTKFERDYNRVFATLESEGEKRGEKTMITNGGDNAKEEQHQREREVTQSNKSPPKHHAHREGSPRRERGAAVKASGEVVRDLKTEVEEYEKLIQRLQKETRLDDIDQIIRLYQTYEEQNNTLYNHVNELSDEIEKLEKKLAEMMAEKKKYEAKFDGIDPKQRQLQELKAKIELAEKRQQLLEKDHQETVVKTRDTLKEGIPSILESIGIKYEPQGEEEQTMNEDTLAQLTALIEQRANDISLLYEELKGNEANEMPNNQRLATNTESKDISTLNDCIEKIRKDQPNGENNYLKGDELEEKAKRVT